MIIRRDKAPVERTSDLVREIQGLCEPCVGCTDCKGLCSALIDALVLPDVILAKGQAG